MTTRFTCHTCKKEYKTRNGFNRHCRTPAHVQNTAIAAGDDVNQAIPPQPQQPELSPEQQRIRQAIEGRLGEVKVNDEMMGMFIASFQATQPIPLRYIAELIMLSG